MEPLVSVILPIYKGEDHLKEAIDSILNQSYKNLELILINDCSPDNSKTIIESYSDSRITIIHNEKNLGLIGALNIGLENSKGKYIARMDQDDISLKDRFLEQVDFMEKNPEICVLGANYTTFGSHVRTTNFPTKPANINLELHFHSCVCHPLAMFRNESVKTNNLKYNSKFKDTEDWGMWFSIINKGLKIANLNSVLLKYRLEGQSTTAQDKNIRKDQFVIMYKHILPNLFTTNNDYDAELQWAVANGGVDNVSRKVLNQYIHKLEKALLNKGFDKKLIDSFLKLKKDRLICKFTDKSVISGLLFMINQNLFDKKNFKYILAKLISKRSK